MIKSSSPLLDGLVVNGDKVAKKVVANNHPQQSKNHQNMEFTLTKKHGIYADKQKRREYMKNYMATRRAK